MAFNIKAFLANQDQLRAKITKYMKENNISIIPLAKEMKISPHTLHKFMMKDQDLVLSSILKINSFLVKQENHPAEEE